MAKRPKTPDSTANAVLLASRRKCAVCFGLYQDLTVKSGQIAHIDRDPRNNDQDNLVYLCLDHHDDYDRPASQSKRIQAGELKAFRDELVAALASVKFTDPAAVIASGLQFTRALEAEFREAIAEARSESEIQSAVASLAEIVSHQSDVIRRSYRSPEVLVSAVSYTPLPNSLLDQQNAISAALRHFTGIRTSDIPDGGFHRVIQEQIARRSRVVCVFPFFLVPSRRRDWGVLPFAWQTSIAVVLPREHPAAIEWNEQNVATRELMVPPQSNPLASSLEWLERLILHTAELGGTALWVQGYAQFEILLESAQRLGDSRIAIALARTNSSVDTLAAACERLQQDSLSLRSFCVIDPAQSYIFRQSLDSTHQVIVCRHDLHIPVGIGFSLACLPMLLIDGRWKKILETARQQYIPFADDFEALGIRFSGEFG
jgi:hypothetical protein